MEWKKKERNRFLVKYSFSKYVWCCLYTTIKILFYRVHWDDNFLGFFFNQYCILGSRIKNYAGWFHQICHIFVPAPSEISSAFVSSQPAIVWRVHSYHNQYISGAKLEIPPKELVRISKKIWKYLSTIS